MCTLTIRELLGNFPFGRRTMTSEALREEVGALFGKREFLIVVD